MEEFSEQHQHQSHNKKHHIQYPICRCWVQIKCKINALFSRNIHRMDSKRDIKVKKTKRIK